MKQPYPYQQHAIQLGADRNFLIADACGLGKTLIGVEIGKAMQSRQPVTLSGALVNASGVLIVCSKNKRQDWLEEAQEQCKGLRVSTFIIENSSDVQSCLSFDHPFYVVIHYERLVKLQKELATVPWLVVVADEVQKIMNRKALRTKALKAVSASAVRKIGLTGTPIERHVANAWSILNWLYPVGYDKSAMVRGRDRRFTSYWYFVDQFVQMQRSYAGYEVIVGNKNLDQFAKMIAPFVIRRTKHDVAPELPPRIDRPPIILEMEKDQARLYKRIKKADDIFVEIGDLVGQTIPQQVETANDDGKDDVAGIADAVDTDQQTFDPIVIKKALAKIVKLQQVTCAPFLLDPKLVGRIQSAKMQWVLDFVDENPDEPVVFFTLFRHAAIWLSRQIDADLVIGGVESPARDFLSGRKTRLVGTLAAMAEGLNLQRASTAVFIDTHWSSIVMEQALDRIHRIDITEPKYIIKLYTKGTVDMLVKQAFESKWTQNQFLYNYLSTLQLTTI